MTIETKPNTGVIKEKEQTVETFGHPIEELVEQLAELTRQNNSMLKEMQSMREQMQLMQGLPENYLTDIKDLNESDRVVRLRGKLQEAHALLAEEKQNQSYGKDSDGVSTFERINSLKGDERTASLSINIMYPHMTFDQIQTYRKSGSKVEANYNNKPDNEKSSKRNNSGRNTIPLESYPKLAAPIENKSKKSKHNKYISSLPVEERLIAIRYLQQCKDKLTTEELKNLVEDKTQPKTNFIKNFFNRNKVETTPEIPAGMLEFISNLKSTISELTPKQELENGQGMRRLLNVANNLVVKNKFTNGKFAKITSDEFCEIALREYELKYNTGKYVKDSVVNVIKFFGVKFPLIDNNQQSAEVIVEPSVIADQVIVQESVNNANINSAKIISKPKAATSENLPNKLVEDQRGAIINVSNQFISILSGKGLSSETLGFQKLIKYSETATSATVIKSAFKQLERLTNDYSNTPNDRKKELLTKSNNEFLRILGELGILSPASSNANAIKKHPPLADVW